MIIKETDVADNYGYDSIKRVLIGEKEIADAVKKAGRLISERYAGKPLLIVGILKGSFVFAADLCRAITIPCETEFMVAESYGKGSVSSGNVKIALDVKCDISKYHVIIAEDIVDTGNTLYRICKILGERNPLSLRVITLLDKPERRTADFTPDYSLFTIPDLFVVGYGLDYGGKMRNLPYIAEAELQ